jgi:Sigma-70, region 4
MSSLESLPQDQRAVLQLVLSRGRSYDQIAQLLKINPTAVRERAHAAVNALGPETQVPPENRGRIADYLLGQVPDPAGVDEVRGLLAHSPGERAWARVVASELAPLAAEGLPEIPTEAEAPEAAAIPARAPAAAPGAAAGAPAAAADAGTGTGTPPGDDGEPRPRSSRLGGIIVLGVLVIVIAGVLVYVLTKNNNSPNHPAANTTSTTTPAASATTATTTTSGSSSTAAKVVAQINLTPARSGSKAVGIAEVLDEGSQQGVAIVAQDVPPNTTKPPNAYAVWLYNSPTDAHILGFVNPGVGKNGRLSTAGALPSNAKHYKKLIVTVETNAKPKTPGTIVLQGTLTGL